MGTAATEPCVASEREAPPDPSGFVAESRTLRDERAVQSLGLAELRSHPGLDRVTSLARRVFGVPFSTVTVLDGERAWFPSRQGIEQREAPRQETFCDTVSRRGQAVVVEDARQDPVFADLPSVKNGQIRFYAGHPLRDGDGNMLGVLCVYGDQPRGLDTEERQTLAELASLASQEILAGAELAAAGEVQGILQPALGLERGEWRVEGGCVPALAVGGDFFDYHLEDHALFFGLGDVMGKGTAAALLGATLRGVLRGSMAPVLGGADPGESLTAAARAVAPDLERAGSFACVMGALVDLTDGEVQYVDAGLGLCLVRRADGSVEEIAGGDRPIGMLPGDRWTTHHTHLGSGDRLLLFSDGLLDLLEDPHAWAAPVAELLASHEDPGALLGTIRRLARARTGLDDVTAVAVYRRAVTG